MAGRYYGQDLSFLIKLREKRQQQLLDLDGQSTSIAAAGYSKAQTNFDIDKLTKDLQELDFEIKRQQDLEAGRTATRPTCSYASFADDTER